MKLYFSTIFQLIKLIKNLKKTPKEIQELQWKRCKEAVIYAYEHVPFYRRKFDKAKIDPYSIKTLEDFRRIPPTTKEELKAQRKQDILARGFTPEICVQFHTSGSSGLPFVSYFDKESTILLKYASKLRARMECGFTLASKLAIMDSYPQKTMDKLNRNLLKNFFYRKKMISLEESAQKNIGIINAFKPDAMYCNPKEILELAEHLKDHHKIHLRQIFTSAELLDTKTRQNIEKAFSCPVYDIYGSTEMKEISWECKERNGYHINEDLYFVEIEESAVTGGPIIVTAFENKAMPLIRYSMGDTGKMLEGQCACGVPFRRMNPTLGRDIHHFILKNGRRISPFVLTDIIGPIQGIHQYKAIQKKKDAVTILVRKGKGFTEKTPKRLISDLQKVLGKEITITIRYVKTIPREASGKYFVIKSEVTCHSPRNR
jgi:phenylacetate-CoA ligase